GRIFLKAGVLNYGFVLAAPATVIAIIAWLAWLPDWLGAPANRPCHTCATVGVLALFVLGTLIVFNTHHNVPGYAVGAGLDSFLGDPQCRFAVPAMDEIKRRVRPGETLSVLPEGIMINYLARVESSVRYDCFLPPVLQMFGEQKIISEFQDHPPNYVL